MIDERFIFLGITLNFIGSLTYIILTLRGKTKPNRVTWFIWALAPLVAFFAEIYQGVGIQSLATFIVGFGPLLVFIASFINKKAYWKISKLDIVCGGLALIGLGLWGITMVGNIAIAFSVLADSSAAIPTVIKSWKAPETESHWVFTLAAVNATIALLVIKTWNFQHYGFPLYILIICIILSLIIKFELGKKISIFNQRTARS